MSPETGTMLGSLRILFQKGVRFSTVIDIGCADGHFFLRLQSAGLVPGAVPLNIDANSLYRDSLQAIQDVVGGHYRICAVTEQDGDIELTMSTHPYWSSLRPADDPYWQRINNLSANKVVVPGHALDSIVAELDLGGPFLLKMDVQGAEQSVLSGAAGVLKSTQMIICETDVDDFQAVNAMLIEKGFVLYDLTQVNRLSDGTLGWFYPIYISRDLDFARPKNFWDAKDNDAITRLQVERRAAILQQNAETLKRIKGARPQPVDDVVAASRMGRNQLCSCGSGRRFKHCCGALA